MTERRYEETEAGRADFGVDKPEGPVSAAVIAGGVGALALGVLTTAAEASKSFADKLALTDDVGPLAGKTVYTVAIWLVAWLVLHLIMRRRDTSTSIALVVALVLIAAGVLGTFPTFFQAFESG